MADPTQQPLRRELTVIGATAIVVANMIGTGIFTTTGFLAGDLGKPSLVVGIWVAGAIVALAGALSYAELGTNYPRSGGEYVYLREIWGPGWAFLSGWVSFFAGFAAPIAAAALAFSEYTAYFFPSLSIRLTPDDSFGGLLHLEAGRWVAILVVATFAVVNIFGLRLAARLQNLLTGLKLVVLGAFLLAAFTLGDGQVSHFAMNAARTSHHSLPAQFAVSLIFVMFAYSGWNAATYVAEEMKHPQRDLPRALVSGTLLVGLLYVALNVAFIYAVPLDSMKGVVRVGAQAASSLFGSRGGGFFAAVMSVGLLSCVSAMVIVGPRVYYAMAQDGCFFKDVARVHSRWGSPVWAIVYQTGASIVMILTGTFESLIYYIGFALILFAGLATLGVFRMRRRAGWKRLPSVSWCYPLVPGLFVAACAWMLLHTLVVQPRESLLGIATILCGALVYWARFRKSRNTTA